MRPAATAAWETTSKTGRQLYRSSSVGAERLWAAAGPTVQTYTDAGKVMTVLETKSAAESAGSALLVAPRPAEGPAAPMSRGVVAGTQAAGQVLHQGLLSIEHWACLSRGDTCPRTWGAEPWCEQSNDDVAPY